MYPRGICPGLYNGWYSRFIIPAACLGHRVLDDHFLFGKWETSGQIAFTQKILEDKFRTAASSSLANYSFYMGTSNDNIDEVLRTNDKKEEVCGIKIFMGSSTGNLLVNNPLTLDSIFANSELLIATHCEDEAIIKANL